MTQMRSLVTRLNDFKTAVILGFVLAVAPSSQAGETAPAEPDGPTLALQIRLMEPIDNSEIRGTLQVKLKRKKLNIPFVCKVVKHADSWETIFTASGTSNSPAETLLVRHVPGQTNTYTYARASAPGAALPVFSPVSQEFAATTPFAGSDFSLADLGLDFLFWPLQQRLENVSRLDRTCYVLESGNDRSRDIVRMKSYIDKEYSSNLGEQGFPALLVAEGYDSTGEMIKKFSLHGSSFKKVNGQYRLKKMEIENEKTGSQTTIEYDLKE